jgi:hypothetical protein
MSRWKKRTTEQHTIVKALANNEVPVRMAHFHVLLVVP